MIARSQAAHSDISVFIDPDVILLPDMLYALYHLSRFDHDWFLICSEKAVQFSGDLEELEKYWLRRDSKVLDFVKLQEVLLKNERSMEVSGRLLMAWNRGSPLHAGILPPFLFGKGIHNEWILNEVLSSGFRRVFDASEISFAIYAEIKDQKLDTVSLNISSVGEFRKLEYLGNCHLAAAYGSFSYKRNRIRNNLLKLVKCSKKNVFTKHRVTSFCLEEQDEHELYNTLHLPSQSWFLPSWGEESRRMSSRNMPTLENCKGANNVSDLFVLPYALNLLLQVIADKNKTVVLTVAGDNYRDMLMNWVCRLRHLEVRNFVVCALDSEIYAFSTLQGLPVFLDPLAPKNISFDNCHFGTDCFQRVTKVKSRVVLDILKLGYNVLLSDVDVYWFENPLPFLYSFGSSTLVAQSDEYNETGPINLPRRLNSGFYFARSDASTISAMEKVVDHASRSNMSEQPSFYDVLCGEGGSNRVGDDQCHVPSSNLIVKFLNRDMFPNGAYKGLWEKNDVRSSCLKLGCMTLHNNWINGRKRKFERQVVSGLWDYDPSSRLCLQSWNKNQNEEE